MTRSPTLDPHESPPRSTGRGSVPPSYRRYRSGGFGWRLRHRGAGTMDELRGGRHAGPRRVRWRVRLTPLRVVLGAMGLLAAWLVLSVVLFLVSSHFERVAPPASVRSVLDPGGFILTEPTNILVLGSDRRQHGSREPGANTQGPSRSDVIMLIRAGGGHSARLSIPRDTIVEIPGHGLQKINAAYAFGGPALSITVVKHLLGIPVNHVVEVNFEDFPELVDAMGGVDYTGPCVLSYLDGGNARGGFTLRLAAGTHHLDGREALALARTRENHCGPEAPLPDIARVERQQALLAAMKARLLSLSSLLRAPLIAWDAPPTVISDMSGGELLALFGALAIGGTPKTHVLEPSGSETLPDGSVGLTVSEGERRAAVARFLKE
ncbi:MAG: LCP family protein [Acidobacteriota bacterium]|nr:LCP family protein [Acidobacteriota bacterium]